jgi:tetratricopeptide (TPR) repeat protein
VATLQEAAERFGDPDLAFLAVRVLHRQGRREEAAQAARDILTAAPDAWPGRTEALQYAAQAAVNAGDTTQAEELLRTSLDLDPADPTARWGLIRLLHARADPDAAFRVFRVFRTPLKSPTRYKLTPGSCCTDARGRK